MRNSWELLVIIIPLLLWIVNGFLRKSEEKRAANRARSQQGGEGQNSGRTSRRASTDLDRFLEEINRRRRQGGESLPVPTARQRAPASTSSAAPRPRIGPRPPTGRTAAARPIPQRTVERIPPMEQGTIVEVLPVIPVAEAVSVQSADTRLAPPSPASREMPAEPPSQAVTQVLKLLRSSEGLQTALILQEVIGPPLSLRRRGR